MNASNFLPPVLLRGIRAARTRRRMDAMGIRIVHRGTQADIAVVQQVFLARDYDLTRLRRHDEIQRFYQRWTYRRVDATLRTCDDAPHKQAPSRVREA